MKARKKFTPFAVAFSKELGRDVNYIDCRYSGISPLVQLVDAMPITMFRDTPKRHYFTVDQVIQWHENELRESHGSSGNQKMIDALRKIKDQPVIEQ